MQIPRSPEPNASACTSIRLPCHAPRLVSYRHVVFVCNGICMLVVQPAGRTCPRDMCCAATLRGALCPPPLRGTWTMRYTERFSRADSLHTNQQSTQRSLLPVSSATAAALLDVHLLSAGSGGSMYTSICRIALLHGGSCSSASRDAAAAADGAVGAAAQLRLHEGGIALAIRLLLRARVLHLRVALPDVLRNPEACSHPQVKAHDV